MICVHVFAKRLSLFLGEKEHGVERDLLDHYKEKGGVQNSVFFGDAIFKWHRTKIFFFFLLNSVNLNNPAHVLKVAKEQKLL